jgi:signal transduction histidine kinase
MIQWPMRLVPAVDSKSLPVPLSLIRILLEPLVGILFTGLWISAESGRQDIGIVAMCTIGLAIAVSRFVPLVAMGLVALLLICQALRVLPYPSSTDWPTYFGIAIVVGIVAANVSSRTRWIALGFSVIAALAAVALMVFQDGGYGGWLSWTGWGSHIRTLDILQQFGDLAAVAVLFSLLAWGSGVAVSAIRRLTQTQQVAAGVTRRLAMSEVELAVAQERNRIAQEMHDVLAHSLAIVVAQADGARYLRPSRPDAVDGALQAIANSARLAMGDLRGVIDGILDGTELPQPTLSDLEPLVAGMASTGMKVVLREAGERGDLAGGQELALYRIVQEGLTNALRHRGRGCEVRLVLDWRGPGVSLLLESTGGSVLGMGTTEATDTEMQVRAEAVIAEGEDGKTAVRCGRGVIGMRERAHVAGGWLTVGLEDDGTHRLTAFLPYYSDHPGHDSRRLRVPELRS